MNYQAQPAEAGAKQAAGDARRVFNKVHLDPDELLAKLQKQGMAVDAQTALPYLTQVGGYRMKGYWYQWLDPESKTFRQGTHFDQIIERYEFDRELRRITGDALERIELMVRAAISNVMSKHHGPHWFENAALFIGHTPAPVKVQALQDAKRKKSLVELIAEEVDRMKKKPFIEHYQKKYKEPALPPSWAISECLSFGSWSTAYPTVADVGLRKEVSRKFKVEDPAVFRTWLHAFSVMRNTVFHHGRLLGANTSVTPAEYRKRDLRFDKEQQRTFYATATIINYVCKSIRRGPRWKSDLEALFAKYPNIPIGPALGFPEDWKNSPAWTANVPSPRKHVRTKETEPGSQLGAMLKAALAAQQKVQTE
ncbi:Abortive infection bacteriophage resistance protein [Bordetella ansorpii]|uniref:Abortive infection bacteriophage resistance protein n=1 Tax=Bordetella ansorpii TaxID=288768 RepID=A0A157KF02_9BORD|nr:Abi family protein [Bordetella ansorpii]SAH83161.1 Abortive infection bacteriophage resistance protein [Bordetella ansorpii]